MNYDGRSLVQKIYEYFFSIIRIGNILQVPTEVEAQDIWDKINGKN